MNNVKKEPESTNELKRRRTASRHAIVVVVLLLLALMVGSSATSEPNGSVSIRTIGWVIISFIGVGVLLWSLFVNYRQADERQQLIQLKASALAFMVVITSLFIAQMLFAIKLINLAIAAQVIFIGSIIVWEILLGVIERQSRA